MWTIYMNCIIADILDPNMLIFIDEAAKNKWMSAHLYGQSMKSVCYLVQRYFVCGARYFIISAITLNGIIAYDIIKGPADGQHFLKFLEEHVASLDQFPYIILTFCWYRCPVTLGLGKDEYRPYKVKGSSCSKGTGGRWRNFNVAISDGDASRVSRFRGEVPTQK